MIDLNFNEITSNHERREEQDIQKKGSCKEKEQECVLYECMCAYDKQTNKMLEKHV